MNSLCGYYMTLLLVKQAHDLGGHEWQNHLVAKETTLNVLSMQVHMVLRMHSFPQSDAVMEPCLTMEDSIEHFFGRVKTCKRETGSTTVATALQAASLLHLRQKRKPAQATGSCGGVYVLALLLSCCSLLFLSSCCCTLSFST